MKKKISLLMGLIVMMLFLSVEDTMAVTLAGDVQSDPIVIGESAKKNTKFTEQNNVKYFQVTITQIGKLTISYSSEKMKKPVTVMLCYDSNNYNVDSKTIKYNKTKKIAKGSLTSSLVMKPGFYTIVVKSDDAVLKDTKFSLSTSFKLVKYNDKEPNNDEQAAQTLKSGTKYNMFLSGLQYDTDMIDYYKINLKKDQKVKISISTSSAAKIRVLLKKKTDSGLVVVNSKESEQYLTKNGSKYEFNYASGVLDKGEYYIMLWLQEDQNEQINYKISVTTK